MKYLLVIFVLLTNFFRLTAADSIIVNKTIKINANYFTTDPLGNIYTLLPDNTIIKYNSNGDSIAQNSEITRGKITNIDASNPLQIILFVKQFGKILLLDKLLSLKNIISLPKLSIFENSCIANSMDGSIWAYDPTSISLKKITDRNNTPITIPIQQLTANILNPIFMTEQDRILYICDTTKGVLKFDQYGYYITAYPIYSPSIQVINQQIIYYQSPYLISYNSRTFIEKKMKLPNPENILQVSVQRGNIYILRNDKIEIGEIQ